ncbi:MAG: hypothetical protein ACRDWY_07140 [Actinomycetes bacterium]
MSQVREALLWPLLGVVLLLAACGGDPDPGTDQDAPSLSAEVVQLRRDEVLERVEIALRNTGGSEVVVERLTLRVPGFRSAGPVPKDSPIPPDGLVYLPTPYGAVRCAADGTAAVGRPVVTLRVRTGGTGAARRTVLRPRDPDGLLVRIAARECTVRRLAEEVDLRFGGDWRPERTSDGPVVHGTLEARLLGDQPRDLTQVGGTVIYSLRAEGEAPAGPLASLTPESRQASVPVVVSVARCDGHARGEAKKPYAFLVWLAPPGGTEVAVSPAVDDASRAAFRQVCPL